MLGGVTMNGVVSALDVARYFLFRSDPSSIYAITHLKLQKLLYYALAFYVAYDMDKDPNNEDFFGRYLFAESLEAWTHGPVCRVVYDEYHPNHSRFEILSKPKEHTIHNERIVDLLNNVWRLLGGYSGTQLEDFTHKDDPWRLARERAGVASWERSNEIINVEEMRIFYKKKMGL